jgi:hypothetical protein
MLLVYLNRDSDNDDNVNIGMFKKKVLIQH